MKSRWRKGVVLSQTLVISVILSMISVMVMKWVLARYVMAARNYRAMEAVSHSNMVTSDRFSFAFTQPAKLDPATDSVDGVAVSFSRTTVGTTQRFTVTSGRD